MSDKKFIVTSNRGIVKKLAKLGIVPCCMSQEGDRYFINEESVISNLSDDELHQISFTDILVG